MTRIFLTLFALATGLAGVHAAEEQKPPATKVEIEFRWLEDFYIQDVTRPRGIQTTCGDRMSYMHIKPVLTGKDVAKATMSRQDLTANGLGVVYSVGLTLTDDARQKLAKEIETSGGKWLAVVVNGSYRAALNLDKASLERIRGTGLILSSQSEAEAIVTAYK